MKPEKMALFRTASGILALNSGTIEVIIETPDIYRLPQLPDGFSGISVDHERLIPVLSDELLSGDGHATCGYLVLCRSEYGLVGVPVCEVGKIVESHEGTEEGPGDPEQPGSIGFFLHREDRYPLLDIDLLLESLN